MRIIMADGGASLVRVARENETNQSPNPCYQGNLQGIPRFLDPFEPERIRRKALYCSVFSRKSLRSHQGILYQGTGIGLAMIRDTLAMIRDKAPAG
jgi:hypothetical protein